MKILHIIPGKVWGGAEQYIIDLGEALRNMGHEVYYITRKAEAVTRRLDGKFEYKEMAFRMPYDPIAIYQLKKIINKTEANVIHIHDVKFVPIAILAARLSHKTPKVILTRHIARRSRTNWLSRRFFLQLDTIVFVSELARKLWLEVNGWMPEEKCVVVHNSIPNTPCKPCSLRKELGINESTPLITFTGRVRKSKGCATIIEALGKIKDMNFAMVFIGACKPKDYSDKLRAMAEQFGIKDKVFFYGFSDNARALIAEADIGLAPSIVREACPLSPMEYMKLGKCVIATNNGAQPEYIEHGNTGFLVSPSDADALAVYITKALINPTMRNEIGRNAAAYFQSRMNYPLFVEKIIYIYNKV
ncbi:MAG: glycosyltransferase family 4 protein, partial [Lachnospiraceae bacterium]